MLSITNNDMDIIVKSLSFREVKLWDIIGELNKQNESEAAKTIQAIADSVSELRTKIEKSIKQDNEKSTS